MNYKKIKKCILILILIIISITFIYAIIKPQKTDIYEGDKINIVCSSFVGYDFVRQIVGNNEKVNITYLMDPRSRFS
jgi:ABC-type Zn uptake system ZnuABC Zn-binding protein ZnuA